MDRSPLAPLVKGGKEEEDLEVPLYKGDLGGSESLIAQLHDRDHQNLITVLIFDQFEEFFFKHTEVPDRRKLYDFLRECLAVPYVWVILSLREDYIHYLLECDRLANLEIIYNDILNKNVRYYVGNFSIERAKAVIKELTERSPYRLEEALVDRLVADLAAEFGEVRPIELQVVGAQMLHGEAKITTLAAYEGLGNNPKRALVEGWLMQVVRDCGQENEELAQRVLYALTDEPEKRPAKTRTELQRDVLLDTPELPEEQRDFAVQGDLDFVLTVPIGSGLTFEIPASPEACYQLIHDYLVSPIRQQFGGNLERQLEEERKKRRDAEKSLRNRNRLLLQGSVLGVIVIAFGIIISIFALQNGKIATANKRTMDTFLVSLKWNQLMESGLFDLETQVETIEKTKEINTYLNDLAVDSRLLLISSIHKASIIKKMKTRLVGHQDAVISASFSPDGNSIITGSRDKTAKLWNLDGDLLQTFDEKSEVNSVAFAPDGKSILTGNADGSVKIWKIEEKLPYTIFQGKDKVNSVAFAPDGKSVLVGSADKTVTLRSLNGNLKQSFQGHLAAVNSVAFAPNGETVLTASLDRTVKLWGLNGKERQTISLETLGGVNSVAFAPNGNDIIIDTIPQILLLNVDRKSIRSIPKNYYQNIRLTTSQDGRSIFRNNLDKVAILSDVDTQLFQENSSSFLYSMSTFFFSGSRLLTIETNDNSRDQLVKLWNLDGQLIQTFKDWGSGNRIILSPNLSNVLTVERNPFIKENETKLWNLDGRLLKTLKDWSFASTIIFSTNGDRLLTIENDPFSKEPKTKLWNLDGQLIQTFKDLRSTKSITFSPSGDRLLTIEDGGFEQYDLVKLWDLDGKLLQTYKDFGKIASVTFSKNGDSILTTYLDESSALSGLNTPYAIPTTGDVYLRNYTINNDGKRKKNKPAKLWSLDGKLLQIYEEKGLVSSVAFAPNNGVLTGSEDGTVKLWSIDGKLQQSFQAAQSEILKITFVPDRKEVLTQSSGGSLKLWRLDGQLIKILIGKDVVSAIDFAPDSKTVLTGSEDGTAKLLETNGKLLQTFQAHPSGISSVAISPDGNSVLTGSWDKTAKLWNKDGRLLQTFQEKDRINSVIFSPDGKSILTGSADKTAKLWSLGGQLLQTFQHNDEVISIAIAPDGKKILTGSLDKTAKLWSLDGQLLQTFKEGHQSGVNRVVFAPKDINKLITVSTGTARLWSFDGKLIETFQASPSISSVKFAPDGNSILIGVYSASLWSLDGRLLESLQDNRTPVLNVAFTPDGKGILVGSADKTAKLWDLNLETSLLSLCKHLQDFAAGSSKPNIPDRALRKRAHEACKNILPSSQ